MDSRVLKEEEEEEEEGAGEEEEEEEEERIQTAEQGLCEVPFVCSARGAGALWDWFSLAQRMTLAVAR